MSDGLKQRHVDLSAPGGDASKPLASASSSDVDNDDVTAVDLSKDIKQGTNKVPAFVAYYIQSEAYQNALIRVVFTILMLGFYVTLIWLGHVAIIISIILVQVICFREIMTIGLTVYKGYSLPWIRAIAYHYLFTYNYFLYSSHVIGFIFHALRRPHSAALSFLVRYNTFISFCLYTMGFITFVLSLKPKCYMRQFSLFAWTHVSLLIIVTQCHFMIQNIYNGLVWFILPVSMIVINDCMAYLCGFYFGRTPLIKLSPKKTWEGFIGGAIFTVLLSILLAFYLAKFDYFVCPVQFTDGKYNHVCEVGYIYRQQLYTMFNKEFYSYPILFHTIVLSIFASLIGPFGGFFASGFKRAFNIKDFSDIIPGHGGLIDRFDCQFLMSTFVYVYIYTFIYRNTIQGLLDNIYMLKPEQQLQLYYNLKQDLIARDILQNVE